MSDEPRGVVLYTEGGDPVRVLLMDEQDEYLQLVEQMEQGIYAFENSETSITMFVEEA